MCSWCSTSMAKWVYRIIFVVGVLCLVLDHKNFTFNTLLLGFPIAAFLAGSYFWIRLDIWRDDETIMKISNSGNVSNKLVIADLVSRRADGRTAFVLITIAALAQALSLMEQRGTVIFVGILLVLIPVANRITRRVEKCRLDSYFKNSNT